VNAVVRACARFTHTHQFALAASCMRAVLDGLVGLSKRLKQLKLPSAAKLSEDASVLFVTVGTRISAFVLQHCCHKLPDLKFQTVRFPRFSTLD
jgi:hypothetical protein